MDLSTAAFIQGVFDYKGKGLTKLVSIVDASYKVPFDKRSQLIYFRAGNSAKAMINVALQCNGVLLRYFPVGAKGAMHVPLAVVEDLPPDATIEVSVAAPDNVDGVLVLDIGFREI